MYTVNLIFYITVSLTSTILIIAFATLLYGNKLKFIKQVAWLFLAYNAFHLLTIVILLFTVQRTNPNDIWGDTNIPVTVSQICRDIAFNLAYWIFSFKYYSIGEMMPYHQDEETPDPDHVKSLSRTYKWLLVANILVPIIRGVCDFLYGKDVAAQF